MRLSFRIVLVGLAAGGLGCDKTATGALGTDFYYVCALPSDAACDTETDGVGDGSALQNIAVGGQFSIAAGLPTNVIVLQSANEDKVGLAAGFTNLYEAKQPGWVSLGAGNDFLNVRVVSPAGLEIAMESGASFTGSFQDGSVDLPLETPTTLRVAPIDDAGAVLAGAQDCTWSVDDAMVAEISSDDTDNVVEITGLRAGTTTLTAQLGDLSVSTQLVVGDAP